MVAAVKVPERARPVGLLEDAELRPMRGGVLLVRLSGHGAKMILLRERD